MFCSAFFSGGGQPGSNESFSGSDCDVVSGGDCVSCHGGSPIMDGDCMLAEVDGDRSLDVSDGGRHEIESKDGDSSDESDSDDSEWEDGDSSDGSDHESDDDHADRELEDTSSSDEEMEDCDSEDGSDTETDDDRADGEWQEVSSSDVEMEDYGDDDRCGGGDDIDCADEFNDDVFDAVVVGGSHGRSYAPADHERTVCVSRLRPSKVGCRVFVKILRVWLESTVWGYKTLEFVLTDEQVFCWLYFVVCFGLKNV